jgi:N-acetylneuraminic acid mutarotase
MTPRTALTGLSLMTVLTGSVATARTEATTNNIELHGWKLLAPIPDRVGFGGMFAGVLNGKLIAGGGSQFPDKPLWLKGEKAFSDRIFMLAAPETAWAESSMRLPAPVASFASAATADAIYLAGGLNTTGCLRQVWELRAKDDGFVFNPLPDLPRAVGYGAGVIVGDRFYVVGGLDEPASKKPSVETWSLDLRASPAQRAWRREPDLPGPGVFVAAAASDGASLYVFGGIGFDAAGKAIPAKTAFRLALDGKIWERLADLPEPRVGISSPCPLIGEKKFFLIGGYAEVFPGAPREHPGFSAQTLYFHPARQRYENGPLLPRAPVPDRDAPGDVGPAPMIGAPCVVWRDRVVVIGGEVRSSVRTPAVLAWPLAEKTTR